MSPTAPETLSVLYCIWPDHDGWYSAPLFFDKGSISPEEVAIGWRDTDYLGPFKAGVTAFRQAVDWAMGSDNSAPTTGPKCDPVDKLLHQVSLRIITLGRQDFTQEDGAEILRLTRLREELEWLKTQLQRKPEVASAQAR